MNVVCVCVFACVGRPKGEAVHMFHLCHHWPSLALFSGSESRAMIPTPRPTQL